MTVRFVVFHSPGENWQTGVDFREQSGVMEHVQHYAKLHAEGKLLLGGPIVEPNSGGMMVATSAVAREELDAFAAADPAIVNGLLTYEIKPWYVPMAHKSLSGQENI